MGFAPGVIREPFCCCGWKCFLGTRGMYNPKERSMALESLRPYSLVGEEDCAVEEEVLDGLLDLR